MDDQTALSAEGGNEGPSAPTWMALALVGAWLVGAYLRLWHLGEQIVIGDEIHALKSAAAKPLAEILQERGLPDVSIPMALWDWLLIHTIGLNEWGLRLPVLLPGLLFLPLISLFTWRRISPLAGVTVAWLAALSPSLVMFSRFARPYMPIMFLSLLSVVLWHQQMDGKKHRGWLALLCVLLSLVLSPSCAPALMVVMGYGLVQVVRRNGLKGLRPPVKLGGGMGMKLLGFVLLAGVLSMGLAQLWRLLPEFWHLAERNYWIGRPVAWSTVAHYLSGTDENKLYFWLVGSLALGLVTHRQKSGHLTLIFLGMALIQVVSILIFVPWGGRTFSVMRYLLVVYPCALILIAGGIDVQLSALRRGMGRSTWPGAALAPLVLAALVVLLHQSGPLPAMFRGHNSFTGLWPQPRQAPPNAKRSKRPAWPQFYNFLLESKDPIQVMESPCISTSPASLNHYASYQVRHEKRVLLLNRRAAYKGEGVELNSIRPIAEEGVHGFEGVDYLVIHMDFVFERHELRTGERGGQSYRIRGTQTERELSKKAKKLVEQFEGREDLHKVCESEQVTVFALDPAGVEAYRVWEAGNR